MHMILYLELMKLYLELKEISAWEYLKHKVDMLIKIMFWYINIDIDIPFVCIYISNI